MMVSKSLLVMPFHSMRVMLLGSIRVPRPRNPFMPYCPMAVTW